MDANSNTNVRVKNSFSIENLLSKPDNRNGNTVIYPGGNDSVIFSNNNIQNKDIQTHSDDNNMLRYETSDCVTVCNESNPFVDVQSMKNFASPDSSCADDNMDTSSEVPSEESNGKFFGSS